MKRLLCWTAWMYTLGILLANFLEIEIILWTSFVLLLVFILKYLMGRRRSSCYAVLVLSCILIGYWRFSMMEDTLLTPIAQFVDKPITFTCWISELPIIKDDKVQYNVQVGKVVYHGKEYYPNTKIRLFYNSDIRDTYSYGDILQVTSTLYFPSRSLNEGGFDYSSYLKAKGVHAICFVAPYQIKKIGKQTQTGWLADLSVRVKSSVVRIIDDNLPKDEGALLKGMMFGIRESFSEQKKEEFSRSGLAHLTAVSGIHLAIFTAGITFLLSIFRANRYIVAIANIIMVILFVFITGCTPSVLRAGTMAIIFFLSYLLDKEPDAITSLSIAALVILVYNPIIFLDVGFQLSFGATICLLLYYKPIYERLAMLPKMVRETAAASIAAQTGTIMITAYHFNNVSLVSIIGNLIIVPMASFVLLSGFILCALGSLNHIIAKMVAGLCYLLLKFILIVVHLISEFPLAAIKVASPSFSIIIAYLLILIILYNLLQGMRNIARLKLFMLALAVVIGIGVFTQLDQKKYMEITFVNVGQGDCILIRCPNGKNIIIDGGGSGGESTYDIGKNIVIPYLLKNGVMRIDMMVASHYHDDHVEGLLSMLNEMPVDSLLLPQRNASNGLMAQLLEKAAQQYIPVYYAMKGAIINIGQGVSIEALYPDTDRLNNTFISENDQSLVLKLHHQAVSFLFTGDIEKGAEEYLINQGVGLEADVIKVPHHGSNTSLTDALIEASAPKYAVVSVGRNNFGHPAGQVLQRLQDNNVKVYRTDINGTITFISDGISIKKVRLFREGE